MFGNVTVNSNVDTLKGVGQKTKVTLNNHGIFTVDQLLKYQLPIQGINMNSLKVCSRKAIQNIKEISTHNWKGRVCHVVRPKGHVNRVVIDDMTVGSYGVCMKVKWKSRGKENVKYVSPVTIMSTWLFWLQDDILSDDSDDETCDPLEKNNILPKLFVNLEHPSTKFLNLNISELNAISSTLKETNQLYNCFFEVAPLPHNRS